MGPFDQKWVTDTLLIAPPLLLSLTVHEFAHARTALAFGDPTAKLMGRVTLNPLAHLDPIGTIVLLFTRMFGWARPVPVNPLNLHPRRLGDVMVSLAGPLSNLALAVVTGVLLRVLFLYGSALSDSLHEVIWRFLFLTMIANICLCLFNLIPLFPLDGHHVLRELLPPARHAGFMEWQLRYGRVLLLGLIFVPRAMRQFGGREMIDPIGRVIDPVVRLAVKLVYNVRIPGA